MQNITKITLAWELHTAGVMQKDIAAQLEVNRDTLHLWFTNIEKHGMLPFLDQYLKAKKGPRIGRQIDPIVKRYVWEIREREMDCCGEKIQYYLKRDRHIHLAASTIYEILAEKYILRSKWKKNQKRGAVPEAFTPREVIQMDTIDFGELFAFTGIDIYTREADVFIAPALTAEHGYQFLQRSMDRRFNGHVQLLQTDGGPEFKEIFKVHVRDSVKAVLSLHAGYSYEDIAAILLLDEITLRRYVSQFQKNGIDGLLECHYTGGQSSLASVQEQQLQTFLDKNTQRTAKEICDHIATAYRVRYSVIGVTKLLHRLGFSYKKPKIVLGKADAKRQARFLAAYKKLKVKMKREDHLYFVDATHPQHNTQPAYGWILKGKAHDKLIKTQTGRQRLNLNGALNLKTHHAIVLSEETINAQSVIRLGSALLRKHRNGTIYVILDNAKYHHATLVTTWRQTHGRVKFIFLPPYSPNLNLIERLWRFFHQKVTWNRYFETFEQFKNESLAFFKNLNQYENELKTLLTDNFQVLPTQKLQT